MKGCVVLLAMMLCAHTAMADAPQPWSAGVADSEQDLALSIYRAGNAEFEESRYAQALAKYRDAIPHWDHPAIRFNMVVCLINLDQPLEAFADLDLALKYGDAPLGADVYAQGLTYRKLLLAQLAEVRVVSRVPGVEVTLDGRTLFNGVADVTQRMKPGKHQIVATKAGFLTQTIPLNLEAGKLTAADIKLSVIGSARTVRRWKAWKPWAVVGAGAAVALLGVPLELWSSSNFKTYNREFATVCPNGCGGPDQPVRPASLDQLEHSAQIENDAAISLFAIGGATVVAGLVTVILNQPHAVAADEHDVRVVPSLGAGAASVVIDGRF